MTSASPHDPLAALNDVLSEVIDVVMALRQAHRKVPETHELHAELGQLFSDARRWAELLVEADTARGVSALDIMPSVAGRQRPDLWHGPVGDEEVRRVVTEQLDRLAEHLRVALPEQDDDRVRELLDRVQHRVPAASRRAQEAMTISRIRALISFGERWRQPGLAWLAGPGSP